MKVGRGERGRVEWEGWSGRGGVKVGRVEVGEG